METLYQILEKNQSKRNAFYKSNEYKFFIKNREYLDGIPYFSHLYDSEDNDFDIMRANIVLYSYLNKKALDEVIDNHKKNPLLIVQGLKEAIQKVAYNLPTFSDGINTIYISFFPKAVNNVYINYPEKLLLPPYDQLLTKYIDSIVDPFDTFGYQLYNSSFTRLILVKENKEKNEAAFFHYDTQTIYFINEQGRLDDKIVLFDKYCQKKNTSHILERISDIIDAYFNFDRSKMIDALHDNKFISGKMMSKLRKMSEYEDEI